MGGSPESGNSMREGAEAGGVARAGEGHVSWALLPDHYEDIGVLRPAKDTELCPVQGQGFCIVFFFFPLTPKINI